MPNNKVATISNEHKIEILETQEMLSTLKADIKTRRKKYFDNNDNVDSKYTAEQLYTFSPKQTHIQYIIFFKQI